MPIVKQAAAQVPHVVFQVVERSEPTAVVLHSQESAPRINAQATPGVR